MNKSEYHDWVAENDSCPEHSHTWIAKFYHRLPDSQKEILYRQFGPFPGKDEAAKFSSDYLENYVTKGFISRWEVSPLCSPADGLGEISDGYHTFNELYEHRHALFLALMRCLPDQSWYSPCHDDGSSYDGWFIAGIGLPPIGSPITYHLPNRLLSEVKFIGAMFLEKAPKWDGHTPDDVVERLYNFLNY